MCFSLGGKIIFNLVDSQCDEGLSSCMGTVVAVVGAGYKQFVVKITIWEKSIIANIKTIIIMLV